MRLVIRTILAGDSARVREMIFRDVSRTSTESFFRSIEDLHRTDLRPRMGEISTPTLGIFGRHDNIVNPSQADVLLKGVPHAHIQSMPHSRHFPMLDEPDRFRQSLISFLMNGHPNDTLA
jgi:pimeloyl-ACP methyl ester carboxylesterase